MSDDESSVGHPGQQPDGTSGSSVDAYFNLNPDKFGTMPTGEFLRQAKEYMDVSESYERAKQTLLELDERKKQLEDAARDGGATEQPAEQPAEPVEEHAETHEEQPQEQPAEEHHEEPHEEHHDDNPLEEAIGHAEEHTEQPVEEPVDQPSEPTVEQTDNQSGDHPQISHAEVDLGGGPAL